MHAQILSIVVGVSGIFGLLALLAYLFHHARIQRLENSVKSIVEGEGLFNSDQIVLILEKFNDDSARLDALRELTNVDIAKAEQLLNKVKNNIDVENLSRESQKTSLIRLKFTAILFIFIALVGGFYSVFNGKNQDPADEGNQTSDSDTLSSGPGPSKPETIPLHYDISSRITFSKWIDGKFLTGLKLPNELLLLNEQGKPIAEPYKLAGEPLSVSSNRDSIFVGQRFPGLIEQFDTTLARVRKYTIPNKELPNQVWSGSPSTEPLSVAAGNNSVWVNTEGNGVPIVYHLNLQTGEWSVPEFEGLGHDNRGWRLSFAWNTFFAVTAETTPSSIYKLTESNVIEFGGHDNESISCTPAIWEGTVGDVTAISCDDELVEIRLKNFPEIIKSWGPVPASYVQGWSHYEITASGNDFVVARTIYNQNPWYPISMVVVVIKPDGTSKTLFERDDVELLSVTSSPSTVVLGIKDLEGKRQAYRIAK